MSIYWPSARAQLTVKLDDFKPRPIETEELKVNPDAIKIVSAGEAAGTPEIMQGKAEENILRFQALRPLHFTVEQNSYQIADEASIDFNFSDTPLTSHQVAFAVIDIFLGLLTDKQFENMEVIPGTRKNLIFRGFVDSWETNFGEQFKISLKCRDFASIFLDAKVNDKAGCLLDWEQPVHKVIRDLASTLPAAAGMSLEVRGIDPNVLQSMSKVLPKSIADSVKRINEKSEKKTDACVALIPVGAGKSSSYWDYMTFIAMSMGFVLYFDVDRIVLHQAKNLDERDPKEIQNAPVITYGHNIKNIEVKRNFERAYFPAIVVIGTDIGTGKIAEGRYPPEGFLMGKGIGRDKDKTEETVATYFVTGVVDPLALESIAAGIYENIARQEIEVHAKTYDFSTKGGNAPNDADLIRLRPGSPVRINLKREDEYRSGVPGKIFNAFISAQMTDKSGRREVGFAESRNFAKTREEILRSKDAAPSVYRVKEIKHSWDNDSGWSGDLTLINYIEIKNIFPFSQAT